MEMAWYDNALNALSNNTSKVYKGIESGSRTGSALDWTPTSWAGRQLTSPVARDVVHAASYADDVAAGVGKGLKTAWDWLGPDVDAWKNIAKGEASWGDIGSAGLDAITLIPGAGLAARGAGKVALKGSAKLAGKDGAAVFGKFGDDALRKASKQAGTDATKTGTRVAGKSVAPSAQKAAQEAAEAAAKQATKGVGGRAVQMNKRGKLHSELSSLQEKFATKNLTYGQNTLLGRNKSLLNPLSTNKKVMIPKLGAQLATNAHRKGLVSPGAGGPDGGGGPDEIFIPVVDPSNPRNVMIDMGIFQGGAPSGVMQAMSRNALIDLGMMSTDGSWVGMRG